MKIFLSWSGEPSHQVALALRDWLPNVIQFISPFISSEDVDRGALWFTEIALELETTNFGILCLTPQNRNAPWILYEAGVLSKSLGQSRVTPLLIGMSKTEIQGPLAHFNSTCANRPDLLKLIQTVNRMLGEQALPVQALDKAFDKWWPDLEPALNNAKTEALCIHITKPPETKPSDSEISELVFDYVKSKRHHLQDEDTHPPENAYLRGKWVDAAYLLPRDGGPGVIYFGSIVSIEFDKRHGAMICTGRNYSYEQTRLGWYKANSSQIGDLKMFYTFEWQPVDGSELILGCGRLMLTGPPLNSGKAIGLQYLTYGGTFISEKLPNFTYEGRRILPEEEDREQAGELVANWIKELSDQRKYRIATKEELNNLFM